MGRAIPALLALLLLSAGCIADGPASPASPDSSDSPTESTMEPVEYAVGAGPVPEEFASLEVTIKVLFAERDGDLGPCWPEVLTGPYKPTPTPLATAAGQCHLSESVTVDLTEVDGERSLGTFTPPQWTGAHAILVTDITATRTNGTTVTSIKGIGGERVYESDEAPGDGPYTVQIGVEAADESARYDYYLTAE